MWGGGGTKLSEANPIGRKYIHNLIIYCSVSNVDFYTCFQLINNIATPYTSLASVESAPYDKTDGSNYVTAYGKYVSWGYSADSVHETNIIGIYPAGNSLNYTGVKKVDTASEGGKQYETTTGTFMSVVFGNLTTVQDCVVAI